ncbi:hypothetical protein BC834DRAFT_926367 [Gloeopeniophorella convolvens]|nr:hypothetical protein BC834DRAFT_926367 [Gloeopeniophorella convolvens]
MESGNNETPVAADEPTNLQFHPLFSFEADVVLGSRDGVLFRVPSTTLKMTSSWFRAMFTLPQREIPLPRTLPSSEPDAEVITLDEESRTLEPLLRMICGLEIPTLETWDAVEPILYAAEKYDMPGPASIVRALLRTPAFLDAPLRLYAAACHFGWADDARLASARSLTLDLHAPAHRGALLRLRTPDLLALFELHHTRRAQFRARLTEAPFLTDLQLSDVTGARCSRCREPISYSEWRELKHAMLYELERRPAGDTVLAGLEDWPTAQACWAARCKKVVCGSPVYDKALSSRAIKEVLDSLPSAVEVCI